MILDRFREFRIDDHWLMVETDFEACVRALGPARCFDPTPEDQRAALGRTRTRVLRLPGRPERLHVRRALHGGLLAPLWRGYLLGVGRARRELRATAALRDRGAPVPRPVLATARRHGPLWQVAIATLHEEGARDALEFLRECRDESQRRSAALAAGRSLRCFHDLGGRHRDLHLKNLLIRDGISGHEAIVIDLDRGHAGTTAGRRRRRQEIQRLRRSLRKRAPEIAAMSAAECVLLERAFFEGYVGLEGCAGLEEHETPPPDDGSRAG